MQTQFTARQLADPAVASSEQEIRKCVHCGFCTATCPTYVLLGDERDSPRGRIYLMKDMLENERVPTPEVVKHIDRCLSCLSCVSTCPSGVNYMHLVDHARAYVEARYRRPWSDRTMRRLLAWVLPHRGRLRAALAVAAAARPFAPLVRALPGLRRVKALLDLADSAPRRAAEVPAAAPPPPSTRRGRVVLLQGCAEPVLRPEIQAAAIRLLARAGYEPVRAMGEGCCGALTHHLGREHDALEAARRNVDAWTTEMEAGELSAIVVTASGCGSAIKNYGFLLRNDPAYAERAARLSALARDITEVLAETDLTPIASPPRLSVAYQSACSLQHGQGVRQAPLALLRAAGFEVHEPAEAHLCCGSAGTYNILQPQIAERLGVRKLAALTRSQPQVIASGNIGCLTHLSRASPVPIVHVVELLDWACGGPRPPALGAPVEPANAFEQLCGPAGSR